MGAGDVAREAWTADAEALCQPRDYVPAEAFGLGRPGAAPTRSPRRDLVGSAGVLEQGKGMGWIARKPVRSRTRPRVRHAGDWNAG